MHLPPPFDYWYTSFFFLAGPGLPYEITVSAFSRSPLGRVNTFLFLSLLLTHHISSSVLPPSPCLLALAFPFFLSFLLLLFCTPQTCLWTVLLLGPRPLSFHAFSTTLSHLIPARPFVIFSHTVLSAMADNLCSGMFLTLFERSEFLIATCKKKKTDRLSVRMFG